MPELPEVETIARGLGKLVGLSIQDLEVFNQKSFSGKKDQIIGHKVQTVERRAKLVRIKLTEQTNLLFHLKMTGQLIYLFSEKRFAGGHPSHDWHSALPNKYTRFIITFDNKSKLFFNDLRKFGWCKVVRDSDIQRIFDDYGPDPFGTDFTVSYLAEYAKRLPNRNIKQFLTDQKIIAGVGNIYNDETLFCARISPLTKVKNLKNKDWVKIRSCLIDTLKKGIRYGGTTDSDYVDAEGKKGGMQEHLAVYHRQGKPCLGCAGVVKRIKIGSRGTYYCPNCQKEIHG